MSGKIEEKNNTRQYQACMAIQVQHPVRILPTAASVAVVADNISEKTHNHAHCLALLPARVRYRLQDDIDSQHAYGVGYR